MRKIWLFTMFFLLILSHSAYANPFSDVAADHWAYDAIDKLAEDGIIVGYPDATYKGNKTMTRYEMANLVGRALAVSESEDARITAENKAYIDKLAAEFSSELNSLGVRVSALEEKVGNVKLNGDARIRYQHFDNDGLNNGKSRYQIRVRLRATANINDKVKAVARFNTGNRNLADSSGGPADAKFDNYYVAYNEGNFSGQVGKFWLGLGDVAETGAAILADLEILGTQANVKIGDKSNLMLASGRADSDYLGSTYYNNTTFSDLNLYAAELSTRFNNLSFVADYMLHKAKSNDNMFGKNEDSMTLWGIGSKYNFNKNTALFAQYWKSDWEVEKNNNKVSDDAFVVGLTANVHPRTRVQALYGKIGGASLIAGLSTYSTALEQPVFLKLDDDADLWMLGAYYKLMKGVVLDAEYFNVSGDVDKINKKGQYFQTRLNFKF